MSRYREIPLGVGEIFGSDGESEASDGENAAYVGQPPTSVEESTYPIVSALALPQQAKRYQLIPKKHLNCVPLSTNSSTCRRNLRE
ncbi:hypothetical protein H9659_13045 [Sporosarcina sp. Sa3CUA8]|uniref:Uncharacterized protein n=1 Tax=Sporosarcina gallistercoris TaxID=2762245 RepID=A0ABR8PM68_9BACL|nr:hypothetical protein [Sporosarcina gallistercoris]